jgi:hypothetical protein
MTDKLFKLSSGSDNRTIFQVNDTEATQLLSMVSNAMEPARSWAQNLLEINGRVYYHEKVIIPDDMKSTVAKQQKVNTKILTEGEQIVETATFIIQPE